MLVHAPTLQQQRLQKHLSRYPTWLGMRRVKGPPACRWQKLLGVADISAGPAPSLAWLPGMRAFLLGDL